MRRSLFALVLPAFILLSCAYPLHEAGVKREINSLVRAGEYAKVVDLVQAEARRGRPEVVYYKAYAASLNGLVGQGTEDYYNSKYGPAGMAFRKAMDSYPKRKSVRARLNFSPGEIEVFVRTCSRKLMERGLLEYRHGDLGTAISTWNMLLKFDPANKEAKKAIRTATTQLKRLKTLK